MLNRFKKKFGLEKKVRPCAYFYTKRCICMATAPESIQLFNSLIDGLDQFISNPDVKETVDNLTRSRDLIKLYLTNYQQEPNERNMLLLHKSLDLCSEGEKQLDLLKKKLGNQIAEESQ